MSAFTFDRELHEHRTDGLVVPGTTQVLRSEYFRRRGEYVHLACHLHDSGALNAITL